MKIKFLGTAAAEGVPAIFCECDTCKKARAKGGRCVRTRSQALVDDKILVDFPPDTYLHYLRFQFDLHKIKTCIVTHSHMDHLFPEDIGMRKPGFSQIKNIEPLTFYSDESAYCMIEKLIDEKKLAPEVVGNVRVKPYVPFEAEGYTITPIRASHDPKSTPLVFIIEKDGKALFYANDTSDFVPEAWEYLSKYNKKLGLISLDCTEATNLVEYVGHMGIDGCKEMRQKLFDLGLIDENTICVLNHFSHNGKYVDYDEFSKLALKEGFVTSFDGLEIEF